MAPASSSSAGSWLDKIYLVYFALHIPIMLCVDLVPLYPPSLWIPASSPLHSLFNLREWYLATYADQFFRPPPAVNPNFFIFFTFLELIFHFPVSIWAVRKLSSSSSGGKGIDGKSELLMLVYGLETVLTTACCMFEAWNWDVELVTKEQRLMLLTALYGSYLAIATVLSVDMYTRLLRRLNVAENSSKKTQ